jgi:hypothetical protein
MFSVMKMGTWRRPSYTAIVAPTIWGMMVDALDQVRTMAFWPERWTASTLCNSLASTNGPFFVERDKTSTPYFCPRRRTMYLSVSLRRRVRYPKAGLPQGVLGPGIPMPALPSPPPWG